MSERMDHAAEADDLMRRLALNPAPDNTHDVEWGFREAQIHATLALVEQQRIANLIGVMANALVGVGAGEHSTAEYVRLHQRINPQILAALGLTAEQEGRER